MFHPHLHRTHLHAQLFSEMLCAQKAQCFPESTALHLPSMRASEQIPNVYATGTFTTPTKLSISLCPPSKIPFPEQAPSYLSCRRSLANTKCSGHACTRCMLAHFYADQYCLVHTNLSFQTLKQGSTKTHVLFYGDPEA